MAGVKGRSGGQNRKPLEAHLLHGTYRRDRHGPRPPAGGARPSVAARSDRPPAPPGLSEASRVIWVTVIDKYDGWTPPDLSLLQLGLETLDRRGQCRERIEAEGIVLTTPRGGMKPHPLLRVERDTTMAVLAIFRQLGLSAPMTGDRPEAAS